jgi:hypothetical protein
VGTVGISLRGDGVNLGLEVDVGDLVIVVLRSVFCVVELALYVVSVLKCLLRLNLEKNFFTVRPALFVV